MGACAVKALAVILGGMPTTTKSLYKNEIERGAAACPMIPWGTRIDAATQQE